MLVHIAFDKKKTHTYFNLLTAVLLDTVQLVNVADPPLI